MVSKAKRPSARALIGSPKAHLQLQLLATGATEEKETQMFDVVPLRKILNAE